MKKFVIIPIIILICIVPFFNSCQNNKTDKEYVKKVQLSEETIAVGIYKPTGVEVSNIQYIAEAINIDAGIVYVTLNDADVLKSKLENIDVVVFPELKNGEQIIAFDDEIEDIFKDFIIKKGKGALGFCNGAGILTNSDENGSLKLIDVKIIENIDKKNGLIDFNLTEEGVEMFPELRDMEQVFVNYNSDVSFEIKNEMKDEMHILGNRIVNEKQFPIFVASKCGSGKLFLTAAHPETTPGMRWMIPRMIRWVYGKDPVWYDKNIVRPEIYNNQIILDEEFLTKVDELKSKLMNGGKSEKLMAMDEMQNYYPWLAAKEVKELLFEKSSEVKIRAAKYLVDIEYTYALKDIENAIKKVRNRKVKEQLTEYRNLLDSMTEQN